MSKPINQFFGASETISGDKIVNRFGRIVSDTYKYGLNTSTLAKLSSVHDGQQRAHSGTMVPQRAPVQI